MKFTRKIIVLLTLGYIFSNSLFAEKKEITVGYYENKPLIFQNEQNIADGFFADIIRYIAGEEDWELNYIYGTWNENLERLKSGEIDSRLSKVAKNCIHWFNNIEFYLLSS